MEKIKITDEKYLNLRIDKALASIKTDYSRSYILKCIEDEKIPVNEDNDNVMLFRKIRSIKNVYINLLILPPHSETFNDYLSQSLVTECHTNPSLRNGLSNH